MWETSISGRRNTYKGTEVRICLVHSKRISWMLEGNVEKDPSQQEPTEAGP